MKALIIVDMLDDFVDGKLANPRAQAIVEPLARLLDHARQDGWASCSRTTPTTRTTRRSRSGATAMEGTPGAQVVAALARATARSSPPSATTARSTTRASPSSSRRSAWTRSSSPASTHICVRHSSYGALRNGFAIGVPSDAVCASRAWTRTRRSST